MKTAISGILGGVIGLLATSAGRADLVQDGAGSFQNVRIMGIVDDELRFRMPDGRTVGKQASGLARITVSADRDPAARTLNRAEDARQKGKLARAIGLYSSVRTDAGSAWMRAFAVMRLAAANDSLGEFDTALDFYLELAGTHPLLARTVVPSNYPDKGTAEAKAALSRIEAELRRARSKDVSAALGRLQKAIRTGRRAKTDSGTLKRFGANGKAEMPPDGPMDRVRAAIADGELAKAEQLFDTGLKESGKRDRPGWLVLEAELRWSSKQYAKGGLAAMKVVALHGDRPEVPAALYWAGRCYEGLGRPAKAKELFEECLAQKDVGDPIREMAEARLESMKPPEEGSE